MFRVFKREIFVVFEQKMNKVSSFIGAQTKLYGSEEAMKDQSPSMHLHARTSTPHVRKLQHGNIHVLLHTSDKELPVVCFLDHRNDSNDGRVQECG